MLNRFAIRLCAVYALEGRTFADAEVRDSEIVPIDPEGNDGDTKPFVAIYTDDQSPDGVTLTFEIGASARMAARDPESGKDVIVPGIPPTDSGIEALLDMMERQIHVALNDENNTWAQLLKIVCKDLQLTGSRRGAMKTQSGERFAGREIVFTGKPLNDPEFGREITGGSFWGRFLAQAEAEPHLVDFATKFRALLTDGTSIENWRLVLRALGASRQAGDGLGVTPPMGMDTSPDITEAQTEMDVSE
ncbi:MAG: hypothetical protein KKB37_11330 [Alphaproteobacteria bacterium]|nr:hypothetical protein [Alphaproteobacteria bacterium]